VLVVLGDQPGMTSELVAALIRAFRETGRGIVVPAHASRRGHPLLLATRFCDEVLTRYDGIGLRGLLTAHPDEILELEVSSAAALKDVDSPEDYRQFVKSAGA
jgi:CTP:molybdopterin cytidylyltransferase MocA